MLKKLLSGLQKKYVLFSIFTPVVMIGEVLMETVIPLVMAHIIDDGIANYDIGYVLRTGLVMVACTVFSLVCGAAGGRFSSVAAYGFSRNLRSKLFKKVQSFSFGEMDLFGTGSLVTRLTTDVTNLQNMYQNLIRTMFRAPLMMIFGTVMACFINMRLALIFFITIPFLAFVLIFIAMRAYPRFKVMFKKYDRLNTVVQENLIAIRVVKAFVRGDFECDKFEDIAGQVRDAQVRAEKIVICNAPVMKLVIYMCIIATLWFGGNMLIAGSMRTGELVSFLTYVTQILMSLMMVSMMFVQLILSRASVSRIMEVLSLESIESSGYAEDEKGAVEVLNGNIEFDNVYFSYNGKKENCVLSGINLTVPSGATVGIIGGTGSSKTTLVSLIPRLYDCTEGAVKVGGRNVREYSYKALRDSIGMVLQKNVLFSGTIEDNLKWGDASASMEQIKNACVAAQSDSFVMGFPDGYKTELGQGGVNLSGGQKQRLCIARALLKRPKILILDDSTSAVDTATDAKIRAALREILPGTTKLIIAQRIASVQDSDFIVVLDDGKINGIGKHDELLETNEIYKEVYDSQMSQN